MKFLIVDTGLSEEIAIRLALEGEEVYYYTVWQRAHPDQADLIYGKGVLEEVGVTRVEDFHPYIDKADCIIFPDIGWGEYIDELRKQGKVVWGTSAEGERLENERDCPKELFSHLHYPPTKTFTDFSKARNFVKNNKDKRYVIKVNKVGGSDIKTYVSYNWQDALFHIDYIQDKLVDNAEIVLSEYVQGIEIAVGVFVNQNGYILPHNVNFEHKRFFPDDLGHLTGEMGTVLYFADRVKDVDNLFKEIFTDEVEEWCKENYGVNYLDFNLIISDEDGKPYVLEATSRMGYPHILITLPLIQTPLGKFFYEGAKGTLNSIQVSTDWAVGVGWNAKGYGIIENEGNQPVFFDKQKFEEIKNLIPEGGWGETTFAGVYRDDDGLLRVVPTHGRAIVNVGVGPSLSIAQQVAYLLASCFYIPDGCYRNDIGDRIYREIQRLFDLGYVSSDRYLSCKEK